MMNSLTEGLPPEIAQRIHPDWRKNAAEYWVHRDELLLQYHDQWIGFANGCVIVSGTSAVEILHAAQESGQHPFVTCVGRENEPCRMRRAAFGHDATYPGEPVPVVTVEFRKHVRSLGLVMQRVIPDTGADASAVPWSDCEHLAFDPRDGAPGVMGGVGHTAVPTVVFPAWACLDGSSFPCRLQADFTGHERILGGDVMNPLSVSANIDGFGFTSDHAR